MKQQLVSIRSRHQICVLLIGVYLKENHCFYIQIKEETKKSEVERFLDRVSKDKGVDLEAWETAGRKGKQKDGSSKTREVKLGCVFTQTQYDLCALVIPEGGSDLMRLQTVWRTMLDEGRVNEIIAGAKLLMPRSGQRRKKIEKETGYFNNNAHRMRYDVFHALGLFADSGVVEAGCKTVIGKRLKQSAMKWTVRGANSIIALRCCHLSGRMEDFWEQRAA